MERITCSVKDAAKMIGVGTVTIYKLIGNERLDTVKLGKRRLVKIASIKALIDGGGAPTGRPQCQGPRKAI